jgi:hypothetical protein
MSTRSNIGIEMPDETVKYIYLHHDSDRAALILRDFYKTRDVVEELINLGDLSVLGEDPQDCHAYHRDMGEPWEHVKPFTEADRKEYFEMSDFEYTYLYTIDDEWIVKKKGNIIKVS